MTDFVSLKENENNYVVLCETNEHESESWYYFLKYNGNEKALEYLSQQLEKIDMYLMEDMSTFDLDIDHYFSDQTALEMIKLEVNSVSFHRMFRGDLQMINLGLKKRDDNEDMLIKCYDKLGMGQVEDYIDGEFIHPEDLVDNVDESETSEEESQDDDLVPFPMDSLTKEEEEDTKVSVDESLRVINDSLLPECMK